MDNPSQTQQAVQIPKPVLHENDPTKIIVPKLNEEGVTYWTDGNGVPIPSLELRQKIWLGKDYDPGDKNPDHEKNKSIHKWAWTDRPRIIRWLCPPRFEPWYNKPDSFGISGIRGAGKSALLVSILAAYHARGGSIIDSYQSNDNESLCWLLSPWWKDVVLVHGDGVEFNFKGQVFGTLKASELDGRHLPTGKIILITKMGFGNEVLYYQFLNVLAYQASHRSTWNSNRIDVWGIREAQEFIGSKLRSTQAYNAKQAQDEFVRFHTTALHSGYAVVYDRARYIAADRDIRELTTWQMFKAQGAQDWPRQLRWFFKFITPRFLRHMPHNTALLAGENGGLGIVQFKFPYWLWNTKHGFSITDLLGIEVGYDAERIRQQVAALKQTESGKGHRRVVTDEIHEEIVKRHIGTTPTEEWRTSNKTNGMSLKDLAIVMHISLPTVTKTWRTHVLRECGCGVLDAEMGVDDTGPTVDTSNTTSEEESQ